MTAMDDDAPARGTRGDRYPRLRLFAEHQVDRNVALMGPPSDEPWPEIEGCLTALCTARSGSTLLCRQLETVYELGTMGELLNPEKLKRRSAQQIVAARQEPWFAFKCSLPGVVCAEWSGFLDAYLRKTVFVRLVRKDIIAQCVSHAKAVQTGQWHSHKERSREPVYDAKALAASITRLAVGVEQLRHYAESTGRPHHLLVYEDVAAGGLSAVKSVGDTLGLPLRKGFGDEELLRPIERMGDAVNDEWKSRFLKEMSPSVGRVVDDYVASIEGGGPANWAEFAGPNPAILRKAVGQDRKLEAVLARFPEDVSSLARTAVEMLRTRYPTATCALDEGKRKLSIRFGPDGRTSNAIFIVAVYEQKSKIFFSNGSTLEDPDKILKGKNGKSYFTITQPRDFERESVIALLEQAVSKAAKPLPKKGRGLLIIKSEATRKTWLDIGKPQPRGGGEQADPAH